jgi:quinol-cytochrome oxidoreductase complex cytochrome b subunit
VGRKNETPVSKKERHSARSGATKTENMQSRWSKQSRLAVINNHLVDYPTPANRSYYWGFGSLAGRMLVVQLVTGIFLAMHYTPHVTLAFSSVEHIMRDVNYGWLVRYVHANGASFFFVVVYRHMMRGLYYGSYAQPRGHLWGSGVRLFLRMMGTGFIGYVLPFGQMSLWGATVITNLASAIPRVGQPLVEWVWGGFSVDNATLNRFFSLHFTLPFVIAALARVHLVLLHAEGVGSGNPLGVDGNRDRTRFYPYFYVKDRLGFLVLMLVFSAFVFFAPNARGHPDNYIPANAMVTPAHIVPEWYFRIFYAILRSIPHKLRGVVAMLAAILRRMARPYLNTAEVRSSTFRPRYRQAFWFFVVTCMILGWIGQKVVEYPYIQVGQRATVYYFAFLLVRVPARGRVEAYLARYRA